MKEVQVAAKLGPAGEVGEAADGDRARVAGEDGVFRRVLAEVFEDALLGVEILDHRLDDNIRIAHALADAAGILDPRDGLLGLVLRQSALLDGALHAGEGMPDQITIYKRSHERATRDMKELVEEIRRTILHEVGHHFGMDEDELPY